MQVWGSLSTVSTESTQGSNTVGNPTTTSPDTFTEGLNVLLETCWQHAGWVTAVGLRQDLDYFLPCGNLG